MTDETNTTRAAGRARLMATAGVLTIALSGCMMVGPDFKPPEAPAAAAFVAPGEDAIGAKDGPGGDGQGLVAGQRISGDWWTLMRSKRLDEVLRMAVADNRNLAAARATLKQAQEQVAASQGGLFPQIDFSADASRQQSSFATQGVDARGRPFNLYSIGPRVSYNLDVWGGERRQVEQQKAFADYQDQQLNATYLSLTGGSVGRAIEIASLRAQIKVIEEIIGEDERNLRLVQEELKVGEATKLDTQSASSQLATDRAQLPPLKQQLSQAKHALSVLAGQAPGAWQAPDFELAEFTLPKDLPASVPSELVRKRPDILAAESQLHAATAGVGVATAQLYPQVNLSASLALQALSPNMLFSASNMVWSLATGLTAPIFHGGALTAQKRGAEAAMEERYAAYQQTVLEAFGQVADILSALKHDGELVEEQRTAADVAKTSLDITRTSYQAGHATLLQVLDAERLYSQARLGHVRAVAQRQQDTAQLYLAMGGGWWEWRGQERPAQADGKTSSPKVARKG